MFPKPVADTKPAPEGELRKTRAGDLGCGVGYYDETVPDLKKLRERLERCIAMVEKEIPRGRGAEV
jgi:hypothetical protein